MTEPLADMRWMDEGEVVVPSSLTSQVPQYRWPLWQVPAAKALGARARRERRAVVVFMMIVRLYAIEGFLIVASCCSMGEFSSGCIGVYIP